MMTDERQIDLMGALEASVLRARQRARALGEATVTPTDDEREGLAQVLHNAVEEIYPVSLSVRRDRYYAQADDVLAAGFRRSERSQEDRWEAARALRNVGTDGELLTEADALVASWDQKGSWSPDSPVGLVMRLAAALRRAEVPEPSAVLAERERAALHAQEGYRLGENCDDIAKRIRSGEPAVIGARFEPQGEPSDAQVEFPFTYGGVTLEQDDGGVWVSDGGGSSYWISPRVLVALRAASEVGGEGR